MLKKSLVWLAAFLLLLIGTRLTEARAAGIPVSAQAIPDSRDYSTKAKGAVVLDADTGRVIFAQNANLRLPMASTTKMMTALLTLEQERPDDYFIVDTAAIHVEGSSMGLCEGDSVSLRALAYGMLLPSGNDGANAAAVRIAGSKEAFVALMNERAALIGMEDTNFVTPSGLDDPRHSSTAYDMALLAREALQNADFADICSRSRAVVRYGNPPYDRWLQNHNRLLKSCEGVVGVKTGFTDAAGRCLVSAAGRGGMRLIVVTLGCPDDWNTHAQLYDRYFELLHPTATDGLMPTVSVAVAGGTAASVTAVGEPPAPVAMREGETLRVVTSLQPFVYAPVQKGQVLGVTRFYCEDEPVGEATLTAGETVDTRDFPPRPRRAAFFRSPLSHDK